VKLRVESIALFWSLKCVHPVLIKARSILTKDNNMPQFNLTSRSTAFPLILLVLIALVLQGCFHNDDDPAPVVVPDANPAGYYDVTGTASVEGAPNITDLQALMNGNRLMMMSDANGLLYDGTITDITENSFTADVVVYKDGESTGTATASGTITEGSSITGTLTGSGFGSGTFSLTYALSNSQAADLARVENAASLSWRGEGLRFESDFNIDDQGILTHVQSTLDGVYDTCRINGTIVPVNNSSLYSVNVTLTQCDLHSELNGVHTGLSATRDDLGVDDRLVFMISNTAFAYFGEFNEN
jgi:hypothetical protein